MNKKKGSSGILRTRSGCANCKKRRIKCDEAIPECQHCVRRGLQCPGYQRPVRWANEYPKLRPCDHDDHNEQISQTTKGLLISTSENPVQDMVPLAYSPAAHDTTLRIGLHRNFAPNNNASYWSETLPSLGADLSLSIDTFLGAWQVSQPSETLAIVELSPLERIVNGSIPIMQSHDDASIEAQLHQQRLSLRTSLQTEVDILREYYFSTVCVIYSGFDSPTNPFRTCVPDLISANPVVHYCILGVSAIHLCQKRKDLGIEVLSYLTEAVTALRIELSQLTNLVDLARDRSSKFIGLLVGTLLLGTTSTWHEASSLGLSYLYGARALLNAFCSSSTQLGLQQIFSSTYEANFVIGAMAFWEALASFHIDQDPSDVDYLWPLCDFTEGYQLQFHSWTGVSTRLFVLLAKVGSITRRFQGHALPPIVSASVHSDERSNSEIYLAAIRLHEQIRQYQAPSLASSADTGDELSPVAHFTAMARIYRLTMLLELYRVFPSLLYAAHKDDTIIENIFAAPPGHWKLLTALAMKVLTLFSTIPSTSRTKAIQVLPFVIAGSALQHAAENHSTSVPPGGSCAINTITSFCCDKEDIIYWRSFVQQRLTSLEQYVGLECTKNGLQILQNVWNRADTDFYSSPSNDAKNIHFVHWPEIMVSEKLETLFG